MGDRRLGDRADQAGPKDTLTARRIVGTEHKLEQAGLTLKGPEIAPILAEGEEPLEIKAK
jgi:hypothetical protein